MAFQKFKTIGDKKKKKKRKAPSKDKGLKQKQKQKVIVNVTTSSGGAGGGYIPMPQAPDYGSLAGLITSLRPTATQDVQLRQAPVYEPAPVKQEETMASSMEPARLSLEEEEALKKQGVIEEKQRQALIAKMKREQKKMGGGNL